MMKFNIVSPTGRPHDTKVMVTDEISLGGVTDIQIGINANSVVTAVMTLEAVTLDLQGDLKVYDSEGNVLAVEYIQLENGTRLK